MILQRIHQARGAFSRMNSSSGVLNKEVKECIQVFRNISECNLEEEKKKHGDKKVYAEQSSQLSSRGRLR
jgi:3-deoxy-D-arabino-heptulosonate 7-phosphate (DAHP) synthase class II